VAIQGVCAWPHLLQLPDGTLIATLFNQPTHGGWEGDLDCWVSTDGGEEWTFRSRPAPHEPGTNRMHCAAGLARDGSMIVLSTGWDQRPQIGTYRSPFEGKVIPPWVSRSSDAGAHWQQTADAVRQPAGLGHTLIPFGMVVQNHDGTLGVSLYGWGADPTQRVSYFYASSDDGRTWALRSVIARDRSETTLLALPDGRLLAAARTRGDMHLDLFSSADAGATWREHGPVSLPSQAPANLLLIADGRIVLCYGNRCRNNYGIDARISRDNGDTWGAPIRLADMPLSDGGYPSSSQLTDGRIVTVFYNQVTGKNHYEMRVVIWDVNAFDAL
jgi:hypothetical protein